jgi:hypothetical protein
LKGRVSNVRIILKPILRIVYGRMYIGLILLRMGVSVGSKNLIEIV